MASKDVVKINYKAKYFYKLRAEEIVAFVCSKQRFQK